MKPIWMSRTFWFNLFAAGVAIAESLVDVVPLEWQPYLIAAYSVGNIILRFDTDTAVSFK